MILAGLRMPASFHDAAAHSHRQRWEQLGALCRYAPTHRREGRDAIRAIPDGRFDKRTHLAYILAQVSRTATPPSLFLSFVATNLRHPEPPFAPPARMVRETSPSRGIIAAPHKSFSSNLVFFSFFPSGGALRKRGIERTPTHNWSTARRVRLCCEPKPIRIYRLHSGRRIADPPQRRPLARRSFSSFLGVFCFSLRRRRGAAGR